jgi:HK97 family phage prohead protease
LEHFRASFEIKAVDLGQRIIEGYASVFGNVDKVGDVVDPAAFADTLRRKAPADVAVFIGHQASTLPVGEALELRADDRGLFTKTLVLDGPTGDQLLSAAKKGLLGLSIGYVPTSSRPDTVAGRKVRRLTSVDLMEYSFAAKAMIANPEALVTAVKTEDAVETRTEWTAAFINDLPDSAFAYVEGGGEKDEGGKTVPRSKRHFPHHGADGSVDLAHLRNALSRAPQSPFESQALPHLKRHASAEGVGSGKTDDAHDPVWATGAAPALLRASHALEHLAEAEADEQKAWALLRIDTKAGRRMSADQRRKLQEVIDNLVALHKWAEYADRDEEGKAAAEYSRRRLALEEVSLWPT